MGSKSKFWLYTQRLLIVLLLLLIPAFQKENFYIYAKVCYLCDCCDDSICKENCAIEPNIVEDEDACEGVCHGKNKYPCNAVVTACPGDDDGGGGGGGGGGGNDECQVDSDCGSGCSCLAGDDGNYCYCPPSPTPPPNHNPSCNLNALSSSLTYDGRAFYDRNRNGARIQQDPTTHDFAIATADPDGDTVTIASVTVSQPACLQASHDGSTLHLTPQGALTGHPNPPLSGANTCTTQVTVEVDDGNGGTGTCSKDLTIVYPRPRVYLLRLRDLNPVALPGEDATPPRAQRRCAPTG